MSEPTSTVTTAAEPEAFQDTFVVGEFRVGQVLSKTFRIYFRNIVSFTLLTLIITAPAYVLSFFVTNEVFSSMHSGNSAMINYVSEITAAIGILGWVLGMLATAAITYGTYQDMVGRKASLGDMLRRGLPMIFSVIGVTLVVSIMAGVGALLLIIPGIMIWMAYMVVIPATVVEGLGVGASLKRSADLTRGFRWKIFGAYFLLAIVIGIIMALISVASVAIFGATMTSADQMEQGMTGLVLTSSVFNAISQAISSALFAVIVAVIYNELRVAKEGADVEQIAAVFD